MLIIVQFSQINIMPQRQEKFRLAGKWCFLQRQVLYIDVGNIQFKGGFYLLIAFSGKRPENTIPKNNSNNDFNESSKSLFNTLTVANTLHITIVIMLGFFSVCLFYAMLLWPFTELIGFKIVVMKCFDAYSLLIVFLAMLAVPF